MLKLDFLLVIIVLILALCLFVISNPNILSYLIKLGFVEDSKDNFRFIIIAFYSLMGAIFCILFLVFARILYRIFRN